MAGLLLIIVKWSSFLGTGCLWAISAHSFSFASLSSLSLFCCAAHCMWPHSAIRSGWAWPNAFSGSKVKMRSLTKCISFDWMVIHFAWHATLLTSNQLGKQMKRYIISKNKVKMCSVHICNAIKASGSHRKSSFRIPITPASFLNSTSCWISLHKSVNLGREKRAFQKPQQTGNA